MERYLITLTISVLALMASVAAIKPHFPEPLSIQIPNGMLKKTVPYEYPMFKQCGESWSNDEIVNETICAVGCLMSSISMALRGHSIEIDGLNSDPGVLNHWLQQNGGYDDDNDLDEEVVPNINPGRIDWVGYYYNNTDFNADQLKTMLDKEDYVVIANVMHGRHFVLVVGYDEGSVNWYVNDPGFNITSYAYDDIVGYRIFTMY